MADLSAINANVLPDFDDEIFDIPDGVTPAADVALRKTENESAGRPDALPASTATDAAHSVVATRPAEPAPSIASPARARRRIIATAFGHN